MSTKRNLTTSVISATFTMGTSYKKFEDIPDDMRITKETEKGTTVWVAKEPKTHIFELRKYHDIGERGWPFGGYSLWDTKLGQYYSCYFDCAVIHPSNFKRKRPTPKKRPTKKKTTRKTVKKKTTKKKTVKKKTVAKRTKKKATVKRKTK